jgi:UDP-sugar transporter A1/2/3
MTLSGEAVLYLTLLALQFAVQPLLYASFIPPEYPREIVVIAAEGVKIALSTVSIFHLSIAEREKVTRGWTLSSSFRVAALPAVLYAIQNLLVQAGYHYVDSTTFNLLNQTKASRE